MPTQTGRIFHIPRAGYELSVSEGLFTDMNSGKKVYELANDSVPLSDIMWLANIGRSLRLGTGGTNHPDVVQEAARSVDAYLEAKAGRYAFARDYALVEPNRKSISETVGPGDDYVAVKLFHNATCRENSGKFDIIGGEEVDLWLPRKSGAFIVPSMQGDSNEYGLPYEVVDNEKRAIARYMEAFSNAYEGKGITDEEARDMLSKWYILGNGWAAVRLGSDRNNGSRRVSLSRRPLADFWNDGRFAASRSQQTDAEGVNRLGARHDAEGRTSYLTERARKLEAKESVFDRFIAEARLI